MYLGNKQAQQPESIIYSHSLRKVVYGFTFFGLYQFKKSSYFGKTNELHKNRVLYTTSSMQ
jgi:hypothetical protein